MPSSTSRSNPGFVQRSVFCSLRSLLFERMVPVQISNVREHLLSRHRQNKIAA